MRYAGDLNQNISMANGSKDAFLIKDILLDEIAFLLKDKKHLVIDALNKVGIETNKNVSAEKLIDITISNLYSNEKFRNIMAEVIATHSNKNYSNAASAIIAGVTESIGAVFGYATERQRTKSEEEASKRALYEKLLGTSQKTNWLPIIIVGGVMLIGVTLLFLQTKKQTNQ
jgi:hypothetical protein